MLDGTGDGSASHTAEPGTQLLNDRLSKDDIRIFKIEIKH